MKFPPWYKMWYRDIYIESRKFVFGLMGGFIAFVIFLIAVIIIYN